MRCKSKISGPVRFLLGLVATGLSLFSHAQDFPKPTGHLVNDFTSTLSGDEAAMLEQKLVAFDDSTSNQIAVVILPTVEPYDISDYAVKLAEQWGVGRAKKNNGVLVLVSKNQHKIWITVGRGLEPVITDALTRRIIETEIVPDFRNEDYYGGLDAGTTVLMKLAVGEFKESQLRKPHEKSFPWQMIVLIAFILFFVLIVKGSGVNRYARRNNLGFWTAWMLMNSMNRRSNNWGGFRSGSGGFGGFGGGGGGFGGFGGGSFGGGGAGGNW